jgi:hypothetical protein
MMKKMIGIKQSIASTALVLPSGSEITTTNAAADETVRQESRTF